MATGEPLLNTRKIKILHAIIDDYVSTTRPVGSERLIEAYNLDCKSATVRNEMANLSDLGYLVQPHTSAGRIPTDRGYRFYVDQIMEPPETLPPGESATAQNFYAEGQNELDEIILQTCRILSGLTSYPSVATDPAMTVPKVRRVFVTEAGPRHLLLVLLLDTGHATHRLVEIETAPDASVLLLTNYVNSVMVDKTLDELPGVIRAQETPAELLAYGSQLGRIWTMLESLAVALSERKVFLQGTNRLLQQPEFHDVQRLEALLLALESQSSLYQVLSRTLSDCNATIIIGSENDCGPMQQCSIISAFYHIGGRPAGFLGVIGPTRMRYDHSVTAVRLMAENLSRVLTMLCVN